MVLSLNINQLNNFYTKTSVFWNLNGEKWNSYNFIVFWVQKRIQLQEIAREISKKRKKNQFFYEQVTVSEVNLATILWHYVFTPLYSTWITRLANTPQQYDFYMICCIEITFWQFFKMNTVKTFTFCWIKVKFVEKNQSISTREQMW